MICTSNCFCIHPIPQICPLATTGCLRTSKECSRDRDLAQMKKWYRKLRRILRPKTNRSTKRHRIVRETLESVYHSRRRLCWWIKLNFALKFLFHLLGPKLIEWCVSHRYHKWAKRNICPPLNLSWFKKRSIVFWLIIYGQVIKVKLKFSTFLSVSYERNILHRERRRGPVCFSVNQMIMKIRSPVVLKTGK